MPFPIPPIPIPTLPNSSTSPPKNPFPKFPFSSSPTLISNSPPMGQILLFHPSQPPQHLHPHRPLQQPQIKKIKTKLGTKDSHGESTTTTADILTRVTKGRNPNKNQRQQWHPMRQSSGKVIPHFDPW